MLNPSKQWKMFLPIFAGLVAFSAGAHAQPVCDTVEHCNELIAQANARIQELEGYKVSLGNILTNADVIKVGITPSSNNPSDKFFANFKGANDACKALHERLPNIHELALAMNPSAVSDTKKAGYDLIQTDNTKDFYINNSSGYKSPSDLRDYMFWSSSGSSNASDFAFLFYGLEGSVDDYFRKDARFAVRCAQGR